MVMTLDRIVMCTTHYKGVGKEAIFLKICGVTFYTSRPVCPRFKWRQVMLCVQEKVALALVSFALVNFKM